MPSITLSQPCSHALATQYGFICRLSVTPPCHCVQAGVYIPPTCRVAQRGAVYFLGICRRFAQMLKACKGCNLRCAGRTTTLSTLQSQPCVPGCTWEVPADAGSQHSPSRLHSRRTKPRQQPPESSHTFWAGCPTYRSRDRQIVSSRGGRGYSRGSTGTTGPCYIRESVQQPPVWEGYVARHAGKALYKLWRRSRQAYRAAFIS